MKGDIVCVPENIEQEGFDFIKLADVPEDSFPLYAIQETAGTNNGVFRVYHPVTGRLFGWSFPENAVDYLYVIEEAPGAN